MASRRVSCGWRRRNGERFLSVGKDHAPKLFRMVRYRTPGRTRLAAQSRPHGKTTAGTPSGAAASVPPGHPPRLRRNFLKRRWSHDRERPRHRYAAQLTTTPRMPQQQYADRFSPGVDNRRDCLLMRTTMLRNVNSRARARSPPWQIRRGTPRPESIFTAKDPLLKNWRCPLRKPGGPTFGTNNLLAP